MGYLSDLFVGVGNTSTEERLLHIGISHPITYDKLICDGYGNDITGKLF